VSEDLEPKKEAPEEEAALESKADDAPKADEASAGDAKADDEAKADEAKPTDKSAEEETGDVVFDTLWARVLEAWDDDKPHGALVTYAVKAQKLPELAGKYKSLTNDPEKKARAQKRLDGVVMAATQLLFSMKTPPPPKSNKVINIIATLMAVSAIIFLVYRIMMARAAGPAP
jgi:hypothetical protein